MFKKILTAALVTSMLILPVSSVGPAGSGEAPASAQTQGYLPGDVPIRFTSTSLAGFPPRPAPKSPWLPPSTPWCWLW